MDDPKKVTPDTSTAEPLSGSSDDLDDTSTTMRLQTLKLESELWPDEDAVDPAKDEGADPHDTGRIDANKI
jgi:hypothetical protein